MDSRDLATPTTYKNISFCRTEDSGYHTSFTSPSLECSNLSNESLDPSLILPCKIHLDSYALTPGNEVKPLLSVQHLPNHIYHLTPNFEGTPATKRTLKRTHEGVSPNEPTLNISTPTSVIATEVQKLKVNDTKFNSTTTSLGSENFDPYISNIFDEDYYGSGVSKPTTPVKKICRSSCNLSPFTQRKSFRKIDFAIHSLSCESQLLKLQPKTQCKGAKSLKFGYKPNQKIDIINMLYTHEKYYSSSIRIIFSYLSQEDIYNFTLVSPTWSLIFKKTNTRETCRNFFKMIKYNFENQEQIDTPKSITQRQIKPLKEIQNVNVVKSTPRSPPRSPRTTRFNKFTKAASLDDRSQMSCISCQHPAKVTTEASGETWVECTSTSCAFQFCKLCKCERHPGKSCIRYDLVDGPSPSKRKKNVSTVSSNNSRKKLRRLLF